MRLSTATCVGPLAFSNEKRYILDTCVNIKTLEIRCHLQLICDEMLPTFASGREGIPVIQPYMQWEFKQEQHQ